MNATGPIAASSTTTGLLGWRIPSERDSARPNRRARSALPARRIISAVGCEYWIATTASRSSTLADRTIGDSSTDRFYAPCRTTAHRRLESQLVNLVDYSTRKRDSSSITLTNKRNKGVRHASHPGA